MFAINVLFLLLQGLYIVAFYCVLDSEVQISLGNVHKNVKKAYKERRDKRNKKEKVDVDDDVPDWVKQTQITSHKKVRTVHDSSTLRIMKCWIEGVLNYPASTTNSVPFALYYNMMMT